MAKARRSEEDLLNKIKNLPPDKLAEVEDSVDFLRQRGDVVLVPFPFTDQTTTKQRSAVVVSSDAYHRDRPDGPHAATRVRDLRLDVRYVEGRKHLPVISLRRVA